MNGSDESEEFSNGSEEGYSSVSDTEDAMVNLTDVPDVNTEPRDPNQDDEGNRIEMLNPSDLLSHMANIIDSVCQIIQVPSTYARLMLTHFRWDKDALMEFYFGHDPSSTFAATSLINPARTSDSNVMSNISGSENAVCDICCLSFSRDHMFGLTCNHFYCLNCWKEYLRSKLFYESQIDRIFCPAFGCNVLVQDEQVFQMSTDLIFRRRFQKLISNSFVLNNRSLTWCPGIDCGFAAHCLGPRVARQVKCTNCSESFCFACGQPWHDPVLCQQLARWLKKIGEDMGTSSWIVANTKNCPKCNATIEKSGGCNHMICRNVDCKYEFCWLCLDRWEPHGSRWYTCNRYDEVSAKQARSAQTTSHIALQRYLFYFSRYTNHIESLKFEARLYESVQGKMEALQTRGASFIDVKFFREVVNVLCSCRRTLMYTYAFAYFLKKNNHSLIFESNQSDLEQATEQLSELLDRDLSTTPLDELKQKVQDRSRYCEKRMKVLLSHVHEGYEKDLWEQADV